MYIRAGMRKHENQVDQPGKRQVWICDINGRTCNCKGFFYCTCDVWVFEVYYCAMTARSGSCLCRKLLSLLLWNWTAGNCSIFIHFPDVSDQLSASVLAMSFDTVYSFKVLSLVFGLLVLSVAFGCAL